MIKGRNGHHPHDPRRRSSCALAHPLGQAVEEDVLDLHSCIASTR